MNTSTEIAGRLQLQLVMLIEIEAQMEDLDWQIAGEGHFINLDDERVRLTTISGQREQVLANIRALNKEYWDAWPHFSGNIRQNAPANYLQIPTWAP